MIIKSRHHWFYYTYFKLYYAYWKIHQYYHKVFFFGSYEEKEKPLLIIANHISWWDGIWVMYLNTKYFKRKFHFMMLEDEIIKNPVCNKVGGYSVKKGSRSIIESIGYTTELLKDKRNMVLLFPQGKIQSQHTPEMQIEYGFDKILQRAMNGNVQTIFVANIIDNFSDIKPNLYIYFKEYMNNDINADQMQADYNIFYKASIAEHLRRNAERQ